MFEIPQEYISLVMKVLLVMAAVFAYRVVVDAMRGDIWRDDE